MKNPIRALVGHFERRLLRKVATVQAEALIEVVFMFPEWWDTSARQIVTAGARRLLGKDADEGDVALLTGLARSTAFDLAVEVRTSSATVRWFENHTPRLGGLRDELLKPMQADDELTQEMLKSISNYGINPQWLRSHFTV